MNKAKARVRADRPRPRILGMPFDNIALQQAVGEIRARLDAGQSTRALFVNAHCANIAVTDTAYRDLIETADMVFADGSEKAFKVPSGSSSGLKIKIKPELVIVANEESELLLDLDLAKSFKVGGTGGDPTCDDLKSDKGKASFKPVVRAFNVDLTGVLAGAVADANGDPVADAEIAVYLKDAVVVVDSEPVATTFSAPAGLANVDEGEWALRLEPGAYDVYVRAPDTDLSVRFIQGATIKAGHVNDGQAITLP